MGLLGNNYDSPGGNLRLLWDRSHITDEEQAQIARITVEAALGVPRVCEVEIKGGPKKLMDFGGYRSQIGKTISVFAYGLGDLTGDIVFRGTIASREFRTDPGHGSRLVLRAYDGAYEMMAARRTRSFKDMSYGEIAKKIAGNYSLDSLLGSDISTSGTSHPFVVQSNETDWDFLVRLAREQGWVTFVRVYTQLTIGKTQLFFGPPKKATGTVSSDTKFKLGDRRVRSVRASVTSAGIPKGVAVPGWDDAKSKDVSGDDSVSSSDLVTAKIDRFQSSKKAGTVTTLETFASTKAQADRAAKGAATRIAGGAIDVTLLVRGNPLVKLNRLIKVEDFGDASGIHTVSGISHVFDPSAGGFTTEVLCSGLDDRTFGNLAMKAPPPPRFHGVYPAIVSDIDDPKKLGRVKLSLPWLDSKYVTDWCRVLQLGAGKGVGLQLMPRPKDEVVVAFENGQLDSPFVIGSVFGKETGKIPNTKLIEQGKPVITALTTKAGHQLIFDDSADSSSITLQVKNGTSCSIVLSDKHGITITTKGDNSLTINSAQDVIVKTERNAKVTAKDVAIDSQGPVKVTGKGKVDVSAPNINVSATSALKLKGTNVTIDATASLTMKAAGTTTIKGAVVKLN
jgi:phage protein D